MLKHHAAGGVPFAALGLCAGFALLACMQNWVGIPTPGGVLTATMLSVALWGGGVWLWLRNRPATAANAHPLLLSFVVALAIHHAIQLGLQPEPEQTVNHALAALASAYFMSCRRWFLTALLVCIAGWLPMALLEGLFSEDWRYWTAVFGTSLLLATAAFEAKRKTTIRLESMRSSAEQSRREAQQALAKVEVASVKHREMEKVLHEAHRREALGKLAGGIAHDFNNLLAIIVGNVELMRHDAEPGSDQSDRLQVIDEAANRAALLTNQILVYAGKAQPRTAEIDLGVRAQSIVALFQSSLGAGVTLVLHAPNDNVRIKADGALIDQVMVNLVQNAVEACAGEGGTIDIRLGYLGSDSGKASEFAFIEVADSGCGMDEATQDKAFDPFFTTKTQSSGLGLSVVKGIAESHAAEIKLRSSQRGTIVRFVVPTGIIAPDVDSSDVSFLAPQQLLLPLPVLVVDDDRGVLQIAESHLKTAGYSVLAVESGASALKLISEGKQISAALIDLTMPEMPGLDLAVALRAKHPDLPVVIMSGFDRDNALTHSLVDDDFVFLPKPFKRAQLVNLLSQAVEMSKE